MVAKRMSNVPESGTVKIGNLVSRLKQEGADIISFNMGEPDFNTPENITEACVSGLEKHFTHYTPSAGIPELRKAVAERMQKYNHIPCKDRNVLITPTKQAIFMTMLAMVEEGDEVIIPDPEWGTFDACARLAGATVKHATLDPAEQYRMTPEKVMDQVTPRTKLLVMNSPSNPCGAVLDHADVKGIAEIAQDHDICVLTDEIYERLIFEGKNHSIASFPDMFDRTITIGGMSKTYAMTGWRLGWAVAPEPIFKELNKLQTQSITCVTSFVQYAGVEALNGPQDAVDAMFHEFRERRDLIFELMSEIPSLHCERPKGAFYLFPSYDQKISSEDMATYLLEKAHVAVTPGIAFGPAGEGKIRISYAASREEIAEGMDRMKKALARL